MKNKNVVFLLCGLVAAVFAVILFSGRARDKENSPSLTKASTNLVAKGNSQRQVGRRRERHRRDKGTNEVWSVARKRFDPLTVKVDELDDELLKKTLADLQKMLADENSKLFKRVRKMQQLLDDGKEQEALYEARELRLSKTREERIAAVGVLGWFGAKAMPELTEMLSDPDPLVAEEAYERWEMAYDELQSDDFRSEVIIEVSKTFDDEDKLYSLMMELTKIDRTIARTTLENIINAGDSTATAKFVAEDLHEHLFGEITVDPNDMSPTLRRIRESNDAKRAMEAAEAQGAAAVQ